MHKHKFYFFMLSFLLCGCATQPNKGDLDFSDPLIQIPLQRQEAVTTTGSADDIGFSDISLSMKKRITAMTTNAEIQKDTNDYVQNGQAEVITRPNGTILYPYGLAEVYLTTKRMMYSKIVLQEGEKIMSMAAGDTVRWNILSSYIGDANSYTPVVLVKPFMGGLQTSLSIITDKRDYDITIQSVDRGDFTQRMGFYYPQDKADAINIGLPPGQTDSSSNVSPKIDFENIKFDYTLHGDKRLVWYPTKVFEDGNKVFIKMSSKVSHDELPAFMAINEAGQIEVVNYRYFRPYFVIDDLFSKGVLVLGADKYQKKIYICKA